MSLSNTKESTDGEIIFASWGLKADINRNEDKKKLLLQRLSPSFSEQELCDLIGNNTVLILDLNGGLHHEEKDIIYKPWNLDKKLNFSYKDYVDFSLKKYIGLFWKEPFIKVILNNEEIPMFSYSDQLERTSNLIKTQPSEELMDCLKTAIFFKEGSEKGKPSIKEIDSIVKEQEGPHELPLIIKENDSLLIVNEEISIAQKGPAEITVQGILVYSEGRLVGRGEQEALGDFFAMESRFDKGGFKLQGIIELKEFLHLNIFKTVYLIFFKRGLKKAFRILNCYKKNKSFIIWSNGS